MKYIIRTIKDGKRIPLEEVNEKRNAAKKHILNTGVQYVEVEAMLGSYNAMSERIEEKVFIVEDVQAENYV